MYRNNHYVPEWYQRRFLVDSTDGKYWYLDLCPELVRSGAHTFTRHARHRWGPPSCFWERDLYTTRLGSWESTEIEQQFFGKIDSDGRHAVEYLNTFEHPSVDTEAWRAALLYMSVQKLRTPKGLASLAQAAGVSDKNHILYTMQRLRQMFCAIWSEAVWCILDASLSETKFIVSDHPSLCTTSGVSRGRHPAEVIAIQMFGRPVPTRYLPCRRISYSS